MKIDDIIITGEVISGIESHNNTSVNVFPNPNKGNFSIVNDGQIKSIRIFNILGKSVYQNISNIQNVINIEGFESGIYFIQFTTNENEVSTSKLVVE